MSFKAGDPRGSSAMAFLLDRQLNTATYNKPTTESATRSARLWDVGVCLI